MAARHGLFGHDNLMIHIWAATSRRLPSHDPAAVPPPRILHNANALVFLPASSELWDRMDRTPHDFFHTAAYHRIQQQFVGGEAYLAVYGGQDKFVAWPYLLQLVDKGEKGGKVQASRCHIRLRLSGTAYLRLRE